jgi:hypothetical protein
LVNDWQQLLGGVAIALLDGRQDPGNFAQRCSEAWGKCGLLSIATSDAKCEDVAVERDFDHHVEG